MRITCVGAGPAGLYFAVLAACQGHDVTVLERLAAEGADGWGITLPDELLPELRGADPESGERIAAELVRWDDIVVEVSGRERAGLGIGGWAIGRRRLRDLLLERARALGVEVRFEHPVDDVGALTGHDLLVGADGVNSMVRGAFGSAFGVELGVGLNRYVWLGVERVPAWFTYAFAPTSAGWVWAGYHVFDETTSTFAVETTEATWRALGFDRADAPTTLRRLEELFAPQLGGAPLRMHMQSDALAWQQFRHVRCEQWHTGNVVLLGDAAHTTHFTLGSGTRLALEDAMALASSLADGGDRLEPALAAYSARRRAEVAQVQAQARLSSRFFEQIDRYIGRGDRFPELLGRRESGWLHRLPPNVYLGLMGAAGRAPWVADAARAAVRRVRG
jgi:2-polyprenyl-6-methoxyphenol hydroxylase-like FAD-dependent oxidoreductase